MKNIIGCLGFVFLGGCFSSHASVGHDEPEDPYAVCEVSLTFDDVRVCDSILEVYGCGLFVDYNFDGTSNMEDMFDFCQDRFDGQTPVLSEEIWHDDHVRPCWVCG